MTSPASASRRHVFEDTDALAQGAAQAVAAYLGEEVRAHGSASLMLTGGSTPEKMYSALASLEVPWPQISLWFGDERAVGPDDDASNYKMVARTLLHAAGGARCERMRGEAAELEAEAARYAALLPEPISLLLLGVGEDAHVASLFPGHAALHERTREVIVVRDSPKPPPTRLSITPRVIESARAIFVLAAGAGKAAALAAGLAEGSALPLALAARAELFLDRAAASRL